MIRGTHEERCEAILAALESGINYFDTAPVYGKTLSETHLGEALHDLGATPIVATKVALEESDFDDLAASVVDSVLGSLRRLRLQQLPVVHLHNRVGVARSAKAPFGTGALLALNDVFGPNGVLEGFRRLQRHGLVCFVGCSAFGGDMTCVNRLIESGEFDTIMLNYSMLNQSAWIDDDHIEPSYRGVGARAAAAGMGTVALRILEGGALAAGFDRHRLSRDVRSPDYAGHVEAAAQFRDLVDPSDSTLISTAIRFVLSNTAVSIALLGVSETAHVRAAVDAANRGPLQDEQLERISARYEQAARHARSPLE